MNEWPQGVDRISLETVDSTMSEARRRASDIFMPTWIHALQQTAGTGRRGRAWDTGAGNFSATLVIRPKAEPAQLALRSFVASLALFDALQAVTGRVDIFTLKWPNDVLLHGGKLAGILLETIPSGLLIGVGVNLETLPPADVLEPHALPPKTLHMETGVKVQPDAFLDVLAPSFQRWETQMTTYGFEPIREAWLQKAANIGKPVRALVGSEVVKGTFTTVDGQGALVLDTVQGHRAISAGDVHFNEGAHDAASH